MRRPPSVGHSRTAPGSFGWCAPAAALVLLTLTTSAAAEPSAVTVDVQGTNAAPDPDAAWAPLLALTLEEDVVTLAVVRMVLPAPDKPGDPTELILTTADAPEKALARLPLKPADVRTEARYEMDDGPVTLPSRHLLLSAPVDSAWARLAARRKLSRSLEIALVRAESDEAVQVALRPMKRPRGDDPATRAGVSPDSWAAEIDGITPTGEPNHFELVAGLWTLDRDLVVPREATLHVRAGVTLRIAPARSIFAYGKLELEGTPTEPITIESNGRGPWGAIGLLGAEASGVAFRYVRFVHGSQAHAGIRDLNGTVTAVDANLEIEGCRFERGRGEDAIHIERGTLRIARSSFVQLASDGIDLVHARGTVDACWFEDIGDDAVDAGQRSTVTVTGGVVQRAGGKAISAGQGSNVDVSDAFLLGSGRGISSFEGASVSATRVVVAFSRRGGLQASARKGTEVGTINIHHSLLWRNGSEGSLETEHVTSRDLRTDVPVDLTTYEPPRAGDGELLGPAAVPEPWPELPVLHAGGVARAIFLRAPETGDRAMTTRSWFWIFAAAVAALAGLLALEYRLRL